MVSKTNQWRAQHGYAAYKAHSEFADEEPSEPAELNYYDIAGVLTDLRHLCEVQDIDFDAALDLSNRHFCDEAAGGDDWLDVEEEPEVEPPKDGMTQLVDELQRIKEEVSQA